MSLSSYSRTFNYTKDSMKQEKKEAIRTSKKRMATSPAKGDVMKRSAFGDITNAMKVTNNAVVMGKENIGQKTTRKIQVPTRKSLRVLKQQGQTTTSQKTLTSQKEVSITEKIANVTLSLPNSQKSTGSDKISLPILDEESQDFIDALDTFSQTPTAYYEHEISPRRKNLAHDDVDAENIDNPSEAPVYALVIFEYMRSRENQFPIRKYLAGQTEITMDMRAILVDWMVEVQENFELNHETLYLAVKLVDLYLQEKQAKRDILQLIGATSLLIAAKFDERHPPYIDDFLYICDDAYNRKEMLSMERHLLHTVGFDINIPISYRFLRRYAKCSKTNMQTLTLGRFILELSLQYYQFVDVSDSLLASAALWLAFKMNDNGSWTETLEYFSSHKEWDVMCLAVKLNSMIIESKSKKLQTVWQKYSHSIFYEVAKTPTLTEEKIQLERARQENAKENASLLEQVSDALNYELPNLTYL